MGNRVGGIAKLRRLVHSTDGVLALDRRLHYKIQKLKVSCPAVF